jgi:hypothetical protein
LWGARYSLDWPFSEQLVGNSYLGISCCLPVKRSELKHRQKAIAGRYTHRQVWHKKADALSMTTTKRIASQADVTGEQQLAGFIKKFDPKNAALIRSVRKVLRERLPTANELVYDMTTTTFS